MNRRNKLRNSLALLGALIGLAGYASADATYSFSGAFTEFNGSSSSGTSESLGVIDGGDFTLSYTIPGSSSPNTVTAPSTNINLGNFTLTCTQPASDVCNGDLVTFPAFTFVITLDDSTDGGIGTFTGASAGGTVSDNFGTNAGSSSIQIAWTPLQLGPGSNGASSGSFGANSFSINSPALIVDPTTNGGVTSVQGIFDNGTVPEPATLGLVGSGLLLFGFVSRRRATKR